tara:strand:+ start:438 stop:596 length:159 start_codon:yes stop_codon:yes gene_type:complete
MGKGSKARPIPDREKFTDSWDAIFGKKEGAFGPLTETEKEEVDDSNSKDTEV